MAYKDILVHVDRGDAADARVETALALAAAHQAHVVGLYTIYRLALPGYALAEIPEEVLAARAEEAREEAAKAETTFRGRAEKAGVAYEWRRVEGDALDALALNARYCDVAVVGQRNPDAGIGFATVGVIPDDLLLTVGRPVIVVPCVGRYPSLGERVMVAWDAGHAATRAVNDALPLLVRARKVSVLTVNPKGGSAHGQIPSADIAAHLARHGVKAEAQSIEARDIDVGDMLLSRAADQGIDLLVMGAYGHARWRELIMGGVTRHLLDHMTLPVLMSH